MRTLWRVIVKEFLQIRRDRRMIPVIFVAPVVQILVFGFAVNTDVTDVRTVVVNGRVLMRASGTEPVIRVMVEARSSEQAERVSQALAAVVKRCL